MDITYCGLCEAEATSKTPTGTPLCATCSQAWEMGQAHQLPDLKPYTSLIRLPVQEG